MYKMENRITPIEITELHTTKELFLAGFRQLKNDPRQFKRGNEVLFLSPVENNLWKVKEYYNLSNPFHQKVYDGKRRVA